MSKSYVVVTEDDRVLARGLDLNKAEQVLSRYLGLGEDAYIGNEEDYPAETVNDGR